MRGLRDLFGTRDSPFPAWLELRHPRLARWRENAPYLAFRARRRDHSYPFVQRIFDAEFLWSSIQLVLFLLALPLTVAAVAWFGCLGLTVGIAALAVVIWVPRMAKASARERLPYRLVEVYSRVGVHRQAAVDIFLTGNSGREIAEGVFLECLEKDLGALQFAFFVMLILVPGIYLFLPGSTTPMGMVFGVALMLFLVPLFAASADMCVDHAPHGKLEKLFGIWKGSMPGAEQAAGAVGLALFVMAGMGVLICALAVLESVLMWISKILVSLHPILSEFLMESWSHVMGLMLMIGATCILWIYRDSVRTTRKGAAEEQLARADELYLTYMHAKHLEGAQG